MGISYHHGNSNTVDLPDDSFVHFKTSEGRFTVGLNEHGQFQVYTSKPVAIFPVDEGEFLFMPTEFTP